MDILWHRSDLRLSDNTALAESNKAIPVYVFDTNLLSSGSDRRVAWLRENVIKLKQMYQSRDCDLIVRHGDPRDILPLLADKYDADRVLWNKDYTPISRSRDTAVSDVLDNAGIESQSFHDKGLHEPATIFTNDGDPYKTFTYYHKKWKNRDKREPRKPFDDGGLGYLSDTTGSVPTIEELGFEQPDIQLPKPGTTAARNLLHPFLKNRVFEYDSRRDYPTEYGTSRLSAYLSYGIIGIREVWTATDTALQNAESPDAIESIRSFREQLAWRDFYTQVLYHNPSVVTENFKQYENPINWSTDQSRLDAWKQGNTGYPIVDAGMRQLKQTGYMHNRVRMIVASFLTKDLLIDWREGYHWFRDLLLDHDTANNNGGWQWAASTGTDAQPYFRIFNPMTQGERYDEDASYIKNYVPELSDVSPEEIHSWTELSSDERDSLAPDYQDPIVDHSEQREKAMEMFKSARGEEEEK